MLWPAVQTWCACGGLIFLAGRAFARCSVPRRRQDTVSPSQARNANFGDVVSWSPRDALPLGCGLLVHPVGRRCRCQWMQRCRCRPRLTVALGLVPRMCTLRMQLRFTGVLFGAGSVVLGGLANYNAWLRNAVHPLRGGFELESGCGKGRLHRKVLCGLRRWVAWLCSQGRHLSCVRSAFVPVADLCADLATRVKS